MINVPEALAFIQNEEYDAVHIMVVDKSGYWKCWQSGHPLIVDGMMVRGLASRIKEYSIIELPGTKQ